MEETSNMPSFPLFPKTLNNQFSKLVQDQELVEQDLV
jgi:hypothetical protein